MPVLAGKMLSLIGAAMLFLLAATTPARAQATTGSAPIPPAQNGAQPASQDSFELAKG